MNHFIFKSSKRLIKNEPIPIESVMLKLNVIQTQLRLLRQDNVDMSLKLEKIMIDKHLQMQVDNYFEDNAEHIPARAETEDLD